MKNKITWLILAIGLSLTMVMTAGAKSSKSSITATYDSETWYVNITSSHGKDVTYKYIYSVDSDNWIGEESVNLTAGNTDFSEWLEYSEGETQLYVSGLNGMGKPVDFTLKVVALDSKGIPIGGIEEKEFTHKSPERVNTINLGVTLDTTDYSTVVNVKATTSKATDLDMWELLNDKGEFLQRYAWDDVKGWTSSAEFQVDIFKNGKYELRVHSNDGFWKGVEIEVSQITKSPPIDVFDQDGNILDTSNKPLEITYSGVPKTAIEGETHTILLKANKQCTMNIQGIVHTVSDISQPVEFTITRNGTYIISATDNSPEETILEIKVDSYKPASDSYDTTFTSNSTTWGTGSSSGSGSGNLPQTGGMAWYIAIFSSLGVILVGVAILIKAKLSKEVNIHEYKN